MKAKDLERTKAIEIRKQGLSYSEILEHVKVSQSSLSMWLRDVKLSQEQITLLALKKHSGQMKGAQARRSTRLESEERIKHLASQEILAISKRDLWLLGILAYWCEGSKQRANNVSQAVVFVNSDPFLAKLFIRWLKEICKIPEENLLYSLHIHENAKIDNALTFWRGALELTEKKLFKIYLKRHKISTNRKYLSREYYGLIRVRVKKSTDLNRRIRGWIEGIYNSV